MSHPDSPRPGASGGQPGRGPLANPGVAYEHSDVKVRPLVGFAIGMLVVIAIVYVLMWGLFVVFERQAARNDPPVSPLARPANQMPASTIGEPYFGNAEGARLMTSEPTVLRQHRTMETDILTSYGWTNEKLGVARIPIEEAKKLILQRGLPARGEPADAALGTRRA